jgi:CheY-like chemotaxis protein
MKHILVVDDDVAIRDVIARVLRDEGYAVSTAANGVQALAELRQTMPDAVLLDLVMPELDGEELLRICREDRMLAGVRVAICSTSERARRIGAMFGVEIFIPKPFELGDLIVAIQQLLTSVELDVERPCQSVALLARQLSAETRARTAALWKELARAEDCLQRSHDMVAATSACLTKIAQQYGFAPTPSARQLSRLGHYVPVVATRGAR